MQEGFCRLRQERECNNMAQYSIKICTYDPAIIEAFDRLQKTRKQAAFTHEALKLFLSTEIGSKVLLLMVGKISERTLTSSLSLTDAPCVETPTERIGVMSHSSLLLQNDSSTVLNSILK